MNSGTVKVELDTNRERFLALELIGENARLRRDVQLKDEALRKKSRTIGALRKAKREADAQLRKLSDILANQIISR